MDTFRMVTDQCPRPHRLILLNPRRVMRGFGLHARAILTVAASRYEDTGYKPVQAKNTTSSPGSHQLEIPRLDAFCVVQTLMP